MEQHLDFIPLLLVLLLAFGVPLVLARLRWLPIVVGEILAGVIIGHSGLGLVGENAMLDIFSNIGLAFLMFLAGLEIDFDRLFPNRRRSGQRENQAAPTRESPNFLAYAILAYALTLVLGIPGGFLLNVFGLQGNPWLLAFTLSATSLGVLLPILKQRGLTNTKLGQSIFLTALFADFITIILLTFFLIIQDKGLDPEILSVILLFLIFFVAYRLLGQFFRIGRVRQLVDDLSQVTVQIKVRGAIAILMAFVVMATLLGLELILGAFMAGMIISLIRAPEDLDLIHKLEAFGYGFFVPVFFILVGANLDVASILDSPQSLLLVPILFLVSLIVKTLPAIAFRKFLTWRETIASGILLNTHLSIEVAIAVIGVRLGLLRSPTGTGLILFSIITVLIMPILFNLIMPAEQTKARRWMVVYGAEQLGLQVAKILRDHGEEIRLLEQDPALAGAARKAGFETIYAETIGECLEEATREQVEALIIVSSSDSLNLGICQAATCQGIDHIVAMVNDPSRLPEYRSLGVNPFAPALFRPSLLALMARSPDIFKLLTSPTDDQDVREICLQNPQIDGQHLSTLDLADNVLIMAVSREGDILIPHGKTRLKIGDRLTLLGNKEEVDKVSTWLESG
jgi:Kef-type K+ transport system membrane component KefB/Trk K+ transport system NAD-binding subunit